MTNSIPEEYRDLIDGPVLVIVATNMPDGQPQLSVVWCNSDEDHILMNTVRGRQKERNLSADPRITLLALDPTDPYRFIEVRGAVVEMTEQGGVAHIDELARLYTNSPGFYGHEAAASRLDKEIRVICKIKPNRIRAQG